MGYNTAEFVKGFLNQTLGNKTTHCSYRVMKGDHCSVLVRSDRINGRPSDVTVIAIDLSTNSTRFMFRNSSNPFRYRISENIGYTRWQGIPSRMLRPNEKDILLSGVVDESDTHALIELGNTPFLFTYDDICFDDSPKIRTAEPLPNRVASVKEAIDLITLQDGQVTLLDEWAATPMPVGWEPPSISEEYAKILRNPIDTIGMGYRFDECIIADNITIPLDCLGLLDGKKNTPTSPRQQEWLTKAEEWKKASQIHDKMYPPDWKGINCRKNKWTIMPKAERIGQIIVSPSGNYVKGNIYSEHDADKKENLFVWHKLERQIIKYNF